ncbi:D-lactate dehydrogenase [cytochrome] 1 [Colletotrichum gloeosporioides]|uniref:D-lactate dehydrogenase [cytochrome] 1 n=1 Tax=Colletotrichum gloeosporioides TaxID=474922 RepID=A0A8H4FD40_COLGL|nr:D-lactate dehydrogenase [cytochrome] 1 [Colletotrichum gloeosporioides]KAF3797571.1 D-lactate dehydrogenase [cytochrome] 1 [Colletotrichum gloeosporioides]
MKDWVINVTVVLPDSRIVKTRQRPRKSSAGYNLISLFVGAEGTLGMVTEITYKLAVLPQETEVAVVSFASMNDAATAASKLIRFSGTKEGVHGDIASVKSVIEPFSLSKILSAANKQEEIDLWSGRKEALWTMTSIEPQGFNIWSTDVAVPISKLAELNGTSEIWEGDAILSMPFTDISKQESDKL